MPYEVIKTISGRRYRYEVESYRDAQTGKPKNRWTYAGKVVEGEEPRSGIRRRAPAGTKQKIVASFMDLVNRKSWHEITPGIVAREAGVAHGTFYRYFKNREALLDACANDANVALTKQLQELENVASDLHTERARLRVWIGEYLSAPSVPPGLIRVLNEAGSVLLDRVRLERRRLRFEAFSRYIERLRERGFTSAEGKTGTLATTLSLIIEMLARRTAIEDALLSEDDFASTAEMFDRVLFWLPPEKQV